MSHAFNPYSTPEPVRPLIKARWTAMKTRIIGRVTITTEAKMTFCGVTSPWPVVPDEGQRLGQDLEGPPSAATRGQRYMFQAVSTEMAK